MDTRTGIIQLQYQYVQLLGRKYDPPSELVFETPLEILLLSLLYVRLA